MKPHDPTGPFASTVNWHHFWYCMRNPKTHPHMQPRQPEGWPCFDPQRPPATSPALPSNVIILNQRKRA